MADKSKQRMSFMGKRLGRLVGKTNNSNNNNNNATSSNTGAHASSAKAAATPTRTKSASAAAPSKPTPPAPTRSKKKTRLRSMNSSKRSSDTGNMDNIEPSARALQKQQSQQQLLQKQPSQKEMPSTTTSGSSNNKPSMRKQISQKEIRSNKPSIQKQLSQKEVRSSKKQQQQQQRQQSPPRPAKDAPAKDSAASATTTGTSTAPTNTSGGAMRQRLQELQAMIAANKDEMEQLKAAECVKMQALVRGFLQRKRYHEGKQQQQQQQQQQKAATPSSPKPTANKKSGGDNNNTTPKRKKKKVKKADNVPAPPKTAASSPPPTKKTTTATTTTTTTAADVEKQKMAFAIKIQAVIRGFCQRQKSKKLLVAAGTQKAAKHNKKEKKATAEAAAATTTTTIGTNKPSDTNDGVTKSDHYAWEGADGGDDRYAWNEGGESPTTKDMDKATGAQDNNKGTSKEPTDKTTTSSSSSKKGNISSIPTNKRRSLTIDQADAIKNGSKQKAKARRMSGLKQSSKDNHQDGSGMNEYSWKDHNTSTTNTRDQSMKDQGMADISMPFRELLMENKKESSGSITNPDVSQNHVIAEEDVFEDSDDSDKDLHVSSAHTSKRSSVASSFISKLTDEQEDGSLTSKDVSDAFSRHHEFSDDEDEPEPDLLDLSVMATAAVKQTPSTLTEKDLRYVGKGKKHRSRRRYDPTQDDLSVSVMAVRTEDDESDTEDGFSDEESVASSVFLDNTGKRIPKQDDYDLSVMAVGELEVESEFEIEDYDTEYEEEDYEDDDADMYDYDDDDDDDYSDTVLAVADDFDFDDGQEGSSVVHNPREDDFSITTNETNLPREQTPRDDRRRRRRHHEVDDDGDEIIEAEDVSVLSTASNKRYKRNHHNTRQRAKRESKKSTTMLKPKQYDNQFLLPQYPSDSSEEESYLERKRRQRRSRRSISKKGKKPHHPHSQHVDPEDEEELQRKLDEVNRLIAESRKEMEELMEAEVIKIQAFVRMHQERRMMDSSGRSVPEMRHALSRTGTKEMNLAATTIQALVRGVQARAAFELQRRSKKRSRDRRNRKQRRAQELERKAAEQEAQLKRRLEEVEAEMKRCQKALEKQKATKLQAVLRGFFVRSKDLLNPDRVAAIKIQRLVRAALRVVHLRKRLLAIPGEKAKQVQDILDDKKKTMTEFEPAKFDDMGTRVKMVNFLKKQIEKENETTEKWVGKIKAMKENNVRLISSNSANVCTVERLRMDVKAKEEKRDAMLKLNQQWIDGIKEYQNRVQMVSNNTKTQAWQKQCCEKYINLIVDTLETRYPVKKLVKEVKFLANHSDVA